MGKYKQNKLLSLPSTLQSGSRVVPKIHYKRSAYVPNVIIIIIIIIHQHNADSGKLQTARCIKTEVQIETRKMKDSIAENTKKDGAGRGCMDNCHAT
jgi:hypothetical protein